MLQRLAPAAVILLLSALAIAEPAKEAEKTPKPPPKPTAENIAQWVKDMDCDDYSVRQQAVAWLTAAGKPAVAPVAKAAKGNSLEVTTRAVKVLDNLLSAKDETVKAAAKAALEELAKDQKHPSSHLAWKALQAKNPPKRTPGHMPGQIVFGGNVIRLGAGGAMQMQIAVKNVNGDKEIDVNENGRKVKITENKAGITVTVTDPPKGDAKGKPKEYKAADAKELKKKHPEAHKLYEKYAKGQGAANIQIIGGNIGGAINPIRIGPARLARGRGGRLANSSKLLDEATKQLDQATAKLKGALKHDKPDKLDLAELIKQLEAARKSVAEARKGLGP